MEYYKNSENAMLKLRKYVGGSAIAHIIKRFEKTMKKNVEFRGATKRNTIALQNLVNYRDTEKLMIYGKHSRRTAKWDYEN